MKLFRLPTLMKNGSTRGWPYSMNLILSARSVAASVKASRGLADQPVSVPNDHSSLPLG